MPDNASRRGAMDMGMPLMILAFIVMVGFIYWLSGQAEAERASRVVEEEPAGEMDTGAANLNIDPSALGMDATPFEGQEVRIETLRVASLLGTQGFWLELPNGNPFLVVVTESTTVQGAAANVTGGMPVKAGETATVVGVVTPVSAEVLDAWEAAGTIGANDRIIAEFATHYLEASLVSVTAAAAPTGADGGA